MKDDYPPAACCHCGYDGKSEPNPGRRSSSENPTSTPLSSFEGWLKFHNPQHLNAVQTAVLDFCCPGFLSTEANHETKDIWIKRLINSGVTKVVLSSVNHTRNRRWSGDSNLANTLGFRLSRQCYFGVCVDSSGEDRGGVQLELSAYRNPKLSGKVLIFDLNWADNAECLSLPRSHSFLFLFNEARFHSWSGSRFVSELNELRVSCDSAGFERLGFDSLILVTIPYSVEHALIDDIIDLRRKETQDWLFETFQNGYSGYWVKQGGALQNGFFSLLPTLLDMEKGGSDETQSIAYCLRTLGVSALIFPSARCDVSVIYEDDEPKEWFGWNLVDYRSSPLPEWGRSYISDMSDWVKSVPHGCGIEFGPDRSWQLKGFQEVQEAAYFKKIAILDNGYAMGKSWCFERDDAPDGAPNVLCGNLYCGWGTEVDSFDDLPGSCPQCGSYANPDFDKPVFLTFGEFLNAVYESAVADLGQDPTAVKNRIAFWLDRQHLAEYSGKCYSGGGCSENNVSEVADLIRRSIEENVPFPPYRKGKRSDP